MRRSRKSAQLPLWAVQMQIKHVGKRWHVIATLHFPKLGKRAFYQRILIARCKTRIEALAKSAPF